MFIKNKSINLVLISVFLSSFLMLSSFATQRPDKNVALSSERFKLAQDAYKVYKFEKKPNSLTIALAYTKSSIELDNEDYQKYILLGNIYLESSKIPDYNVLAHEAFEKATQLKPDDAKLNEYIALTLFQKGQYYWATDYFENFVKLNNLNADAKTISLLNTSYVFSGRIKDGCKFYEYLIKKGKNSPDYLVLSLAVLLKNSNQNKQAKHYLKFLLSRKDVDKENKDYAAKLLGQL